MRVRVRVMGSKRVRECLLHMCVLLIFSTDTLHEVEHSATAASQPAAAAVMKSEPLSVTPTLRPPAVAGTKRKAPVPGADVPVVRHAKLYHMSSADIHTRIYVPKIMGADAKYACFRSLLLAV